MLNLTINHQVQARGLHSCHFFAGWERMVIRHEILVAGRDTVPILRRPSDFGFMRSILSRIKGMHAAFLNGLNLDASVSSSETFNRGCKVELTLHFFPSTTKKTTESSSRIISGVRTSSNLTLSVSSMGGCAYIFLPSNAGEFFFNSGHGHLSTLHPKNLPLSTVSSKPLMLVPDSRFKRNLDSAPQNKGVTSSIRWCMSSMPILVPLVVRYKPTNEYFLRRRRQVEARDVA
ncbi:hypothetical protein B0H16DRAFT_1690296 [Mycena metata]|uniref:Uncharacterized protein n=1 Tax=Mycena metata TaxID=1033252 RepID=A0AAD7J4V8_9AGAR|nr:hypothetical protein B0H16DRAFT_1690296 [Mycena metata]